MVSCQAQDNPTPNPRPETISLGITGDKADVNVPTTFGIVLMGGSTDVDEAIRWMIDRASGGDFVVIRASGSTGYNDYIKGLGNLNSVETLLIDSREKANRTEARDKIRNAEALFIAGGDQANYVNFWADTEVSRAIQYLISEKKVPIGGTSAGCAVLGEIIFDAKNGSIISTEALQNPYDPLLSISESFIKIPYLSNTITDQHYTQRDRHGRHVAFMARMMKDSGIEARGIGVDERTAVCIDQDGNATVFGANKSYFLIHNGANPESCLPGIPLHWLRNQEAVRVYVFQGSASGTPAFNVNQWSSFTPHQYWYSDNGVLKKK
ncbi:MAG: cyanophycinase [Cyclobacteriaceae bacterium]|nr:cyanophycinase [Cyclobacteriaceae bacterium]UYN85907.1 MAG: cyanophycinase [Cyclobacteriaceae bacterium]